MRHIGIVTSFDHSTGTGFIQPECGGDNLSFARSGIYQDRRIPPIAGQRLTYQLSDSGGHPRAVDLQNV